MKHQSIQTKKAVNQFKSLSKSSVTEIEFLMKFSRKKESILLRENLESLMHFANYKRDPTNDYSYLLMQTVSSGYFLHKSLITDNFSAGIDTEKFLVLTTMLKHVT